MISEKLRQELLQPKPIRELEDRSIIFDPALFGETRIPAVGIHGRFQPPMHASHFYTYVANAFIMAEHVTILITNPYGTEKEFADSLHRTDPRNNPFSYNERVTMFHSFFGELGMPENRYAFQPFHINDETAWNVLDPTRYYYTNIYGSWSREKLRLFQEHGLKVIYSSIPRLEGVSGSAIRDILAMELTEYELRDHLMHAGFLEEGIPGLMRALDQRAV